MTVAESWLAFYFYFLFEIVNVILRKIPQLVPSSEHQPEEAGCQHSIGSIEKVHVVDCETSYSKAALSLRSYWAMSKCFIIKLAVV